MGGYKGLECLLRVILHDDSVGQRLRGKRSGTCGYSTYSPIETIRWIKLK